MLDRINPHGWPDACDPTGQRRQRSEVDQVRRRRVTAMSTEFLSKFAGVGSADIGRIVTNDADWAELAVLAAIYEQWKSGQQVPVAEDVAGWAGVAKLAVEDARGAVTSLERSGRLRRQKRLAQSNTLVPVRLAETVKVANKSDQVASSERRRTEATADPALIAGLLGLRRRHS